MFYSIHHLPSRVAQLAERVTVNHKVYGSKPYVGAFFYLVHDGYMTRVVLSEFFKELVPPYLFFVNIIEPVKLFK